MVLLKEKHMKQKKEMLKVTLYQISEWMKGEIPYIEATKGHDEEMEGRHIKPR